MRSDGIGTALYHNYDLCFIFFSLFRPMYPYRSNVLLLLGLRNKEGLDRNDRAGELPESIVICIYSNVERET